MSKEYEPYENSRKQVAWEAYRARAEHNTSNLGLDDIGVKTARSNFERWWSRNYE